MIDEIMKYFLLIRRQWQEQSQNMQPPSLSNILLHLPMTQENKLFLSNCINQLKFHSFRDKTVFILTFLTALFSNQDEEEDIRRLNQIFYSLLQKYFKSQNGEEQMSNVGMVLSALPTLSKCLGEF